jgi:hypothetical protein
MMNEPPDHLEGVLNRPGGGAKRCGNAKKILNRGNEPKDLLKRQDLSFSGAQNELFLECKKTRSKPKNDGCGAVSVPPGARPAALQNQKSEEQDSGARSHNEEHLVSAHSLLLSAFRFPPFALSLSSAAFCS